MLVLFTLCQRKTITADELAPVVQKGKAEAAAILERLSQDVPGITEPTRESQRSKTKKYRLRGDTLKALGTAVRYHRRTTDQVDRKVIAHLHEYGKLTNRTLQNIFDIDVWRARDILADLQTRDIIVRTSEAARGPNVEYGKGSAFPKSRPRRTRSKKPAPTEGWTKEPGPEPPSLF